MVWRGMAGAFGKTQGQEGRESRSGPRASFPSSPVSTIETRSLSSSASVSSATTSSTPPRLLPAIIHRWYASLRQAHVTAAREQAAERVQRIREMERGTGTGPRGRIGWGLGSFGLRVSGRDGMRRDHTPGEFELYDGRELSRRRSVVEHQSSSPGHEESLQQRGPDDAEQNAERPKLNGVPDASAGSMWWWGPLRRWRLQDSTVY